MLFEKVLCERQRHSHMWVCSLVWNGTEEQQACFLVFSLWKSIPTSHPAPPPPTIWWANELRESYYAVFLDWTPVSPLYVMEHYWTSSSDSSVGWMHLCMQCTSASCSVLPVIGMTESLIAGRSQSLCERKDSVSFCPSLYSKQKHTFPLRPEITVILYPVGQSIVTLSMHQANATQQRSEHVAILR